MLSMLRVAVILVLPLSLSEHVADPTSQVETESTVASWTRVISDFMERDGISLGERTDLARAMMTVHSALPNGASADEVDAFRRELYLLCDTSSLRDDQLVVARAGIHDAQDCVARCRWGNYALAVVQRSRRERMNVETMPGVEFQVATDATTGCRSLSEMAIDKDPAFTYAVVLAHVNALRHPTFADRVHALRRVDDALAVATAHDGAPDMSIDRYQVLTDWTTHAIACGDSASALEGLARVRSGSIQSRFAEGEVSLVLLSIQQRSIPIQSRLAFVEAWVQDRAIGRDELVCLHAALMKVRQSGGSREQKLQDVTRLKTIIEMAPATAMDQVDLEMSTRLIDGGERTQAMAVNMMPFRADVAIVWFDSLREAGYDRTNLQPIAAQLLADYPNHSRAAEFHDLLR
jgi:hypothetical protein